MAVSSRATVTVRCWKQHTCCACGCVFRYALEKSGKGRRKVRDESQSEAEDEVVQKLQHRVANHPCPACGVFQPDMAARGKLLGHGLLTALSFLPLAALIGMGSGPTAAGALPTDLCALIAAGVAGGFALLHLGIALHNPNGNLEANRRIAEKEVADLKLEILQPGLTADQPKVTPHLTVAHFLTLLCLLIAGPAFLSAVYVRTSNGWPNNAELRPALIGPGDGVRVEVPARHIQAVRSLWRGEVTARVLNAAEVGAPVALKATTLAEPWGDSLQAKKDEVERPISPYAHLVLPDDPALGGKTLRVRVYLSIIYASRGADTALTSEKTTVSRDLTIHLTPVEGRQTYWLAWGMGASVGFFCCVCGGLALMCLAYRLGRKALPNMIVPVV